MTWTVSIIIILFWSVISGQRKSAARSLQNHINSESDRLYICDRDNYDRKSMYL
jgi:hypothetical protein